MNIYTTNEVLRSLAYRILDISYRNGLSHLGSCLTALPIIYSVYKTKNPSDKLVLSAGHSGLALYVVLEHFGIIDDAEARLLADGIHPTRGIGIDVSTGSLGQGITVAVGMALASPNINVYVLCTDGEVAEGSWWEAVYFKKKNSLNNLHIIVNNNGYSALGTTSLSESLFNDLGVNMVNTVDYIPQDIPWFTGLAQHYTVMNQEQYNELRSRL